MRAPPPVRFDCGPDRAWCFAETLLAAVSAAALLGVAAAHAGWTEFRAFAVAAVALLVAGAWWAFLVRRRPRTLAWDGQGWRVDDRCAHVSCALDLGRWMVLRVEVDGRTNRVVTALPQASAERHAARVALLQSGHPHRRVEHV